MDETRAQAYLQLIHTLLTCPNGDEPQILQDNSELLDRGFLQACELVAENFTQQGEENAASFLRNLASQVGQFLDANDDGDSDNSESEDSQEYANFILELLQAEADSNSDIKVIYPMLAERQHLLNHRFAETLQQVAQQLIAEHPEAIAFILAIIESLSIHIKNFPLGSRANNLEIAITGCQIVLNNRQPGSEKFAQTQNNLATAYSNRIRGEKAENIELAIASYTAALTILTPDAFPQDWAQTQNNLANAYSDRIRGERAQNIELAIASYTAALTILTPDAFPENWATTQNNLAAAYSNRIRGEKAQNIELAIASYTAALTIRTREAFPQDWAQTQNNLANAYSDRIRGEKAENIELAITSYYAALTIYTGDAFPEEWAMTQNNLGEAYSKRIRGERAENLERAMVCYQEALEVYIPEAFPEKWANTQLQIAKFYQNSIRGDQSENIEKAFRAYQEVLKVKTRESYPVDWAETHNQLASAYFQRIAGEKAKNIEQAINSYNNALTVYTFKSFPEYWAAVQTNLSLAYYQRIIGVKENNIEQAIAYSESALKVYSSDSFLDQRAKTQESLAQYYTTRDFGDKVKNISKAIEYFQATAQIYQKQGDAVFDKQQWDLAINFYDDAITAVEQSRQWETSQRSKRQILENALPMYEKMVLACIHLERYETALLTVERSKSRTLIELLDNANLYPKNSTPAQKQQLSQLRRQIASLQQQLDTNQPPPETDTATDTDTLPEKRSISTPEPSQTSASHLEAELKTLQQQVTQLLREINDPDFNLTQRVIPQLPDFTQFLDSQTALIEWYLPPNPDSGFHVFIVTNRTGDPPKSPLRRGTLSEADPPLVSGEVPVPPLLRGGLGGDLHIQHLAFTPEQHQQLNRDIATYLSDYGKPTWGEALSHRLVTLAASLQLNQTLAALPPTIKKLILIPHRDLHLLPLHALPATRNLPNGETKTGYWLDLYTNGIQYSPSSQFLERLHQRKRPPLNDILPLFAIQNPTEDLRYTEIEVEEISRRFNPNAHILKRQQATKIAFNSPATFKKLSDSYYAHFSCHGSFNSENPLNSGLVFAGILEPPQPPSVTGEKEEEEEPPQPPLVTGEKEEENRSYVILRDGRRFRTDIQCLTLKEIFASLDLPLCRLVSLSACETGLVTRVVTDEYIGLASGFLYAGASNVVSSLWSVSDFSTAFLMIRFYQNLNDLDLSVSQALQAAQIWLRTIARKDFLAWLKNEVKIEENRVDSIDILLRRSFENQPFADPQYWAAFCAIGI
ncbi:CHAT domain-containing protein [Microcoleus sp. N3A4]|uniref:CHAT domain-containing protein n=1 Tax=Microcoleus sp. N3A4 TaxID=3055379 RepID=UPI002FD2B0D2